MLRFDYFDSKSLYNNVDDDPRIGLTRHHKADLTDIANQAVRRLNEQERLRALEEETSEAKSLNRRKRRREYFTWKLKKVNRSVFEKLDLIRYKSPS